MTVFARILLASIVALALTGCSRGPAPAPPRTVATEPPAAGGLIVGALEPESFGGLRRTDHGHPLHSRTAKFAAVATIPSSKLWDATSGQPLKTLKAKRTRATSI